MAWVRGEILGRGTSSFVNLAQGFSDSRPMMAVKSCNTADSVLLENEKDVLTQLGSCPQIIKCFGDDRTVENHEALYNLLLEYAAGGSLVNLVKKSGGFLKESEVKTHTRSILKGLRHVHAKGFVHCDIKLANLLIFENAVVKIADFGLSKKAGEKQGRAEIRGTPLYMSPESVNDNEYEPPCDVWALGCAVVEMVSGKSPWNFKPGTNMFAMLIRIGDGDELPSIPQELSEEGKDFLAKCFVKDPSERWTAEMLLDHPFVATDDETVVKLKSSHHGEFPITISPRGPFDFPECVSIVTSPETELWSDRAVESTEFPSWSSLVSSPEDRIRQLKSEVRCPWLDSGSWLTVR